MMIQFKPMCPVLLDVSVDMLLSLVSEVVLDCVNVCEHVSFQRALACLNMCISEHSDVRA